MWKMFKKHKNMDRVLIRMLADLNSVLLFIFNFSPWEKGGKKEVVRVEWVAQLNCSKF